MSLATLLVWIALAGAAVLMAQLKSRLFPLLALLSAGFQVLSIYGILSLHIRFLPLPLVVAGVLGVAGVLCWTSAKTKLEITAATLVAVVGVLQIFMVTRTMV